MPKINTTPFTDAQRKRLHPTKVKPPKLFPPTVRKVKEIVPNKLIPKLKPLTPAQERRRQPRTTPQRVRFPLGAGVANPTAGGLPANPEATHPSPTRPPAC